jgi:hypothetical protein
LTRKSKAGKSRTNPFPTNSACLSTPIDFIPFSSLAIVTNVMTFSITESFGKCAQQHNEDGPLRELKNKKNKNLKKIQK